MRRSRSGVPVSRRSPVTRAWSKPAARPPDGPQPPLLVGEEPIPGAEPGRRVRDRIVSSHTTLSTTAETVVLSPVDSGVFLDLLAVVAVNTSASGVRVDLRDSRGGAVVASVQIPAGETRGFVLKRARPQISSNAPWTAQLASAVTDVRLFVQAEKAV